MNFSYTQKEIIELAKENNFPPNGIEKGSYGYLKY